MNCSNYVGKTFGHVAGLLAVSAIGTQSDIIDRFHSMIAQKMGIIGKFIYLLVIILMVVGMLVLNPGPLKYVAAVVITFLLGSSLNSVVKELEQTDTLVKVLVQTVAVSVAIIVLALFDTSGQFVRFIPFLTVGLFALVIVNLYYYFVEKESPTALSAIGGALFTLFIAADTQNLKNAAKFCKKPDYINSSFKLYLDILNLFGELAD